MKTDWVLQLLATVDFANQVWGCVVNCCRFLVEISAMILYARNTLHIATSNRTQSHFETFSMDTYVFSLFFHFFFSTNGGFNSPEGI